MEKTKEEIWRIILKRTGSDAYYRENSDVYRAFLEMEEKAFADGALMRMQKELIAVGIALVQGCEPSVEWHIGQALANGASRQQVLEAIGIGMEMGGEPAKVMARFAKDVLEYYNTENGPSGSVNSDDPTLQE